MGGDNEEVFKGLLGLSDADYQSLADDGHLSPDYLDPEGNPL